MFLSNKVRTAVETQDILFGPHKYKRAVWRLGPHKDRRIGVTVHVCMCVCLPLSSFVTLRSMRKLRMAVKTPSAAYPYHSIPHTAPKQHLSFSSHSTDTNMCVNFPEDWFVSYIMPEKRFSLRAMQGFFLNRAFYYFFSIRQTVAAFYCRNLIKVNKTTTLTSFTFVCALGTFSMRMTTTDPKTTDQDDRYFKQWTNKRYPCIGEEEDI